MKSSDGEVWEPFVYLCTETQRPKYLKREGGQVAEQSPAQSIICPVAWGCTFSVDGPSDRRSSEPKWKLNGTSGPCRLIESSHQKLTKMWVPPQKRWRGTQRNLHAKIHLAPSPPPKQIIKCVNFNKKSSNISSLFGG